MAKSKADLPPAEAIALYTDAARRFARVRTGDYAERREAQGRLMQATDAMVKVFGRHSAEEQMMRLSAQAVRDVTKEMR